MWVNTPDSPGEGAFRSLRAHHPDVFDFLRGDEARLRELLSRVRWCLRMAWDSSDARRRDWFFFLARSEYNYARGESYLARDGTVAKDRRRFMLMPPDTPFDAAVFYAQTRLASKMARCKNPGCSVPYYFRMRPRQESCCVDCAKPTLLESKRRWWKEVGSAARRAKRK